MVAVEELFSLRIGKFSLARLYCFLATNFFVPSFRFKIFHTFFSIFIIHRERKGWCGWKNSPKVGVKKF